MLTLHQMDRRDRRKIQRDQFRQKYGKIVLAGIICFIVGISVGACIRSLYDYAQDRKETARIQSAQESRAERDLGLRKRMQNPE